MREIDLAFAESKRHGANALMVSSDPFLHSRRAQIVALTAQHGIATISSGREWVTAGGLISYGNSIRDAYRRAGLQTGRLLRGVKPTDLPIDRSTRFELGINLTTAKAAVPIVFTSSADPVLVGLVASLSHPGGNVTGVSWFDAELGPKQLRLLSELVPNVMVVLLMVNPQSPEVAAQRETAQQAAQALGWQLHVLAASSVSEIDSAFAESKRHGANALMVSSDPFLHSRRKQIVSLAAHHAIPTISGGREWVAAGGLVSYGNSIPDAYRRAGLQTGRLLRGVKPTDLPVDRSTRFELAINLTTAKSLGLTVPDKLLVAADEVIE